MGYGIEEELAEMGNQSKRVLKHFNVLLRAQGFEEIRENAEDTIVDRLERIANTIKWYNYNSLGK